MVETELTVCLEVFRTDQSLPSIAISESNVNCFELHNIHMGIGYGMSILRDFVRCEAETRSGPRLQDVPDQNSTIQ